MVMVLAFVAGLFVFLDVLWRWDYLLYDAQLSLWTRPVSDDIIIIAIDDESLNELGHWPWPRSIHAELINKISKEAPAAIGLDVIISEPDAYNPESDQQLMQAIKASGKVVLPVYMSKQNNNALPIEALPLPELTQHAAALGHVHVDISQDGIARKVYLKEGIGKPHWNHYSLALLSVARVGFELESKAKTDPMQQYSVMNWSKENPFLIPFAGPPGHFPHIGFSQVLSGEYAKDLFKNKIVLIGATAEGLGDALPTPLSGEGGVMPGVEIVANVIDSIVNDQRINQPATAWLIVLTALFVALPVLAYPYLNPASTLMVLFGIVAGTLVLVALMLWLFGVWLPVSTALLFQFISYPLWSWRRLELAMRHIKVELNELSQKLDSLSVRRDRNLEDEIRFIALFIPVKGWVLQDESGQALMQEGVTPVCNFSQLKTGKWSVDGFRYWAAVNYHNQSCRLGFSLGSSKEISDDELRLMDSLINNPFSQSNIADHYVEDVLQSKIEQVQAVGNEYEELRKIIDDSLSGMADGVLICSSRGQVMLSNHRAGWYLYGDDNADINGKSLVQILDQVQLNDGSSWSALLERVLFKRERVLSNVRQASGRDLMIEISPLRIIRESFDGFVINLSDISLLKASERKRNEVLDFLSHDLRSPLSSMVAMIEIAKNKSSVNEMRAMLKVMEKNTYKTLHLAEQFLQLSRANTSEDIEFHDLDFNSVVLNAIDQIWALSSKLKVSIEHEFEQDELWTHGEPDLLERAITNLLSNAIKHSKPGSCVRVSVSLQQAQIQCCVIDEGTGISAEELPHLFDMFRRTRGAGVERIQGVGLGLAFVDAVAVRHGGHVHVESQLDQGSMFCLIIPRVDVLEPLE